MTREEAIEILKAHHMWTGEPQEIIDVRKENEALEMAIKALEHPEQNVIAVVPCGDCISRQAVLKLKHHKPKYGDMIYAFDVEQLPSVTQKSGKWIVHPEIETSTPEYLMFYECSECGDKQCFCKLDIHKKRFCSNCGAKMQESEDK